MPWRAYRRSSPRRYWVHARVKLGRRGIALTMGGLSYLLQVVLVVFKVFPEEFVLLNIAVEPRAIAWGVAGTVALVYAWRKRDTIGWAALYVMAAYRAIGYFLGGLDWIDQSHGGAGDVTGFAWALMWLVNIGFLMNMAAWPDEVHLDTQERERPEEDA